MGNCLQGQPCLDVRVLPLVLAGVLYGIALVVWCLRTAPRGRRAWAAAAVGLAFGLAVALTDALDLRTGTATFVLAVLPGAAAMLAVRPRLGLPEVVFLAGFLSLLLGALYTRQWPTYVLGGEYEAEIDTWARWSLSGGAIAVPAAPAFRGPAARWRPGRWLAAAGLGLLALAQFPPMLLWLAFLGRPVTEGGVLSPATGTLWGALPHAVLAGTAAYGVWLSLGSGRRLPR